MTQTITLVQRLRQVYQFACCWFPDQTLYTTPHNTVCSMLRNTSELSKMAASTSEQKTTTVTEDTTEKSEEETTTFASLVGD